MSLALHSDVEYHHMGEWFIAAQSNFVLYIMFLKIVYYRHYYH